MSGDVAAAAEDETSPDRVAATGLDFVPGARRGPEDETSPDRVAATGLDSP